MNGKPRPLQLQRPKKHGLMHSSSRQLQTNRCGPLVQLVCRVGSCELHALHAIAADASCPVPSNAEQPPALWSADVHRCWGSTGDLIGR